MKTELLAPVGDWETLQSAIKAGANSIYFGIKYINMRSSSAKNFEIIDLKKIMQTLHKNNMKGYITLNTLIYDHELERLEKILEEVKKAKVDAVIATDMAVVQLCNEKNIEVHISTQESVSNYQAVKFFSKYSPRIVLARECTLEQITQIKQKIKQDNLKFKGKQIKLECFIHGSLCVAYSGRCFMSQHHNRLSANRGQCLQECRKKYKITDLEDSRREFILDEDYILSPKDLCTIPILPELIKAGVTVLKIEGRAKGAEYVYNVTKAYRTALDLIESNKFTQKKALKLTEELKKVFNRGFSTNFYLGTPTNDYWTKFYGSSATEKKSLLGRVDNYYVKEKVVSVILTQKELKEGDQVCFIGPTTGYYKTTVKNMRVNNKSSSMSPKAKKGDEITFKITERVRTSDTFYKIEKRNINQEEQKTRERCENIGIHKPFKFTKKDKGME